MQWMWSLWKSRPIVGNEVQYHQQGINETFVERKLQTFSLNYIYVCFVGFKFSMFFLANINQITAPRMQLFTFTRLPPILRLNYWDFIIILIRISAFAGAARVTRFPFLAHVWPSLDNWTFSPYETTENQSSIKAAEIMLHYQRREKWLEPLNRQRIKHYGRAVDQLTILFSSLSSHNSYDGSRNLAWLRLEEPNP